MLYLIKESKHFRNTKDTEGSATDTIEIIANKTSGKGNGAKSLATVEKYLTENNIPYRVHETQATGDGKAIAERLCAEGAHTLVALGGDGTFHEVLNGIDFSVARMGLIPAGRGNDFAIGTGAASLDPLEAIEDIVRGEACDLDYLQVGEKRCLNVGGTGLDVEVTKKTSRKQNRFGYTLSLFKCLFTYKPYHLEAVIDGEMHVYDCVMIGACNGTQFGGGIRLSPVSRADDGKLDVIVMTKPKHIPTVFLMPKFVKGKHMNAPYTHHFVTDAVRVTTSVPVELDGEVYTDIPFDVKIVAGGFKTFARKKEKKA